MKTVGFSILVLILTFSLSSFAKEGGWGSGGGNARVCFTTEASAKKVIDQKGEITDDLLNQIESIEALDLYEAKLPRGLSGKTIPIAPIRSDETFTQYTDRIINRVNSTVPELGNELLKRRALFTDESVILHDTSLTRIHDEAAVTSTSSANCVLATMAIQQNTGDFWLLHIDNRLFSHPKHSELSRAVLLLHEITYAVARDRGQTESASTRIVVGEMISNAPQTKLSTLIYHWANLGLIDRDSRLGLISWDSRTAPFIQLYSSMFNLSQELVSEFTGFGRDVFYDFYLDETTRTETAVNSTRAILLELKETQAAQNLSNVIDALVYLRKMKNDSRFQSLKNPKKAERVLQIIENYRTRTLAKISDYMNRRYLETYKSQITGFAYLDEEQKATLDTIAQGIMGRFMDAAGTVMTHEQIEEEKKPHSRPPNEISFGTGEGVYSLMDLNMLFSTNIPSLAEQAKRANDWFKNNVWMYFISRRGRLSANDLTLPVFKN